MTQKESSRRIEEIDHEIAKLVEERLDASRKADEGIPASEIAQKCRRYERGFMNSLEQEYKDISGYERVLFQALFDMSHSYKYTMYGTKTELADRIKEAIGEEGWRKPYHRRCGIDAGKCQIARYTEVA